MSRPVFAIRADGNETIGTGHVMRCLAIARELEEQGGDVLFITADDCCAAAIEARGIRRLCLHSQWDDLSSETSALEAAAARSHVAVLIIDSYFVTLPYLENARRMARVVYVDDLNRFRYPCDYLINYHFFYPSFHYLERYEGVKLLLGSSYAPLRKEFHGLPPRITRKKAEAILITTGGTDAQNTAGLIAGLLTREERLSNAEIRIVCGRFNPHLPQLREMAGRNPRIRIYSNVQDMSRLMLSSDIAVSAGGTTLYELCACGAPTVCFSFADNQLDCVDGFKREGIMRLAGDMREDAGACARRICRDVAELSEDWEERERISRKMRELVDGGGAGRIAHTLLEGFQKGR